MYKKIQAPVLIMLIALTLFAFTGKQAEQTADAAAANQALLGMLPQSDFIMYVDAQRTLTDIVPSILSNNSKRKAQIEADMDEFKKETGFDPRTLDSVAIGVNLNSSRRMNDFAVIGRGRFDSTTTIDGLLAAVLKESKGKAQRQSQVYEGRTIYLLSSTKTAQPNPNASTGTTTDKGKADETTPGAQVMVDGYPEIEIKSHSNELAIVALDPNTIAIGSLKSVRATIDVELGRNRVSDELVQLATRNPGAVMSFSGNIAPEMVKSLRFGNGQADNSIASIRQVYGSFDSTGSEGHANFNIRTEAAEQAQQLGAMLNTLKLAAKFTGVGGSGGHRSLAALVKDLTIETVGNEVQMRLKLSEEDLAHLVQRF